MNLFEKKALILLIVLTIISCLNVCFGESITCIIVAWFLSLYRTITSLKFLTLISGKCTVGEFECKNMECIDDRDRCNGITDCSDDSDEHGCETCAGNAFQ